MEISSIFYNLRFIFKDTKWTKQFDQLFGVSFLVIRSIATIGFVSVLIGNKFDIVLAPFITLFCILNIYWGSLIVRKFMEMIPNKKKPKSKSKLSLKTTTVLSSSFIFLIIVYNRYYTKYE